MSMIFTICPQDSSQIQILSLKAHKCMDCNRIFDFHESFLQQLKYVGLRLEDVKIQFDINGEKHDNRIEGNQFTAFKPESFLHTLGYRVGNYGQSESVRHDLLYRIVQLKAMSISEIKNCLSQNIRLFSKREEYQTAVADWKNDIQYMNSLIRKKTPHPYF